MLTIPFLLKKKTSREINFKEPLVFNSPACAGCSITMVGRVMTQIFGTRLYLTIPCGCSHVCLGPKPSAPYCTDDKGRGAPQIGSLFEDGAETTFGMAVALEDRRTDLANRVEHLVEVSDSDTSLAPVLNSWLIEYRAGSDCVDVSEKVVELLSNHKSDPDLEYLIDNQNLFVKPSPWIMGGDGFAYDIGYGGLMHVLSMGRNINVLISDTEVYSNTGGQMSKATARSATAKFCSVGKKTRKKDLGLELVIQRDVYVASIAYAYNKNHAIKALIEAEAYPGPSIVINYSPCISAHGIKTGHSAITQAELAVKSGYWPLYRYNPELQGSSKGPLTIDSKKISVPLEEFLGNEVRFSSLGPEVAETLIGELKSDVEYRNALLENLARFYREI
ncbi:hypothetical protein GEMRC1_007860 [Eukaryota sp. GEM-RC1]